ncbi:hypothetical protein CP532_4286 [Ophiocordyceps camponoti-leonardi (nom. inval.)]|nr:hypothetical protein CP532_4286 [Ophiocordyceps camponoti-leonardi (nom. inval.)]
MASKHPLRRSCAFCRARKIKCSNETICEACRRQGADCIYDFEPPRPKTRTTVSQDTDLTRCSAARGGGCNTPGSEDGLLVSDDAESIARVLESSFLDMLRADGGAAAAGRGGGEGGGPPRLKRKKATVRPGPIKYTGLLALLGRDLLGLASDRIGALGCHHVEEGGGRFFRTELANDDTRTMFDEDDDDDDDHEDDDDDDNDNDEKTRSSNPLSEYGQRQQTQLVDVWFSMHPLSFVISKTLLLRELRDGTYDEILLATMLADANFSIGDDRTVARGKALLRWATSQLRRRRFFRHGVGGGASPSSSGGGGGGGGGVGGSTGAGSAAAPLHGGASTRVFGGISTAQALMLLGWHSLSTRRTRRAACYVGLAARIVGDIRHQMSGASSAAAPPTSSRINGIDVFDVEKEVVSYLYWTTFSIDLWASIQTGHGLVHHSSSVAAAAATSVTATGASSSVLTPVFLPVTEASSVMIKLDLVSENFSTLQKQKAVLREMWPLAHTASIVAYIVIVKAGSRQHHYHNHHHHHHHLQDADSHHRVLAEGINALNRQAAASVDVSSKSLVLLAYHTMAVHLLFPQHSLGDHVAVLDRFCASAHSLVRIFDAVVAEPPPLPRDSSLRSSLGDFFSLAFDGCARALRLIDARRIFDGPLLAWDGRLLVLARALYDITQDDFLNQGRALRMVRKTLKTYVRGPGSVSSGSGSSGVPSPADNPYTPMHSPALAMIPRSDPDGPSLLTLSPPPDATPTTTKTTPSLRSCSAVSVFTPGEDGCKTEWHAPPTPAFYALSDVEQAWPSQMPGVMDLDFDMDDMGFAPAITAAAATAAGLHWDCWPDAMGMDATTTIPAAASDMESVLYYFENGHNKRSC